MAASYSSCASLADIVTALNAKSLITTLYYQDAGTIIWLSPITAKYIKLLYSSGRITLYYGDSLSTTTVSNESHAAGTFTLASKPFVNNSDEFYSGSGKTGTHWVRGVDYTVNITTGVVTNVNMTGTVYCNYQYVSTTMTNTVTVSNYQTGTMYLLHVVADTTYFVIVSEVCNVVANESHAAGNFTLASKPIKPLTDDFWSASGKTGTHWVRDTNYTINSVTGVVTNINMTGTVYCNYYYPTSGGNMAYVGATTGGKAIAFGMTNYDSGIVSYGKICQCKNITDGKPMLPVVFGTSCEDSGNVLTQKLMWRDLTTGQILKNGSVPDDTLGIKNCSIIKGDVVKSANYLTTYSPAYTAYSAALVPTSLLIEW